MEDNIERDQDIIGDKWLTDWENERIQEWQSESNMDDRIQTESERFAQKLWLSFQNSATSIAQLYRERCQSNGLWIPFQNSASGVTVLYKDSLDVMKRAVEIGIQCGHQRRNRELLSWAKKKRRHVRREDLIAYVCGKTPPVKPRLPTATLSRSASKVAMDRPSPRLPVPEMRHEDSEPDLQPFRDAIALQRLNGAMSNISVGYEKRGATGTAQAPGIDAEPCNEEDDFHCFILDEISRRCDNGTGRKRTSAAEVKVDSPTRKRSRLL